MTGPSARRRARRKRALLRRLYFALHRERLRRSWELPANPVLDSADYPGAFAKAFAGAVSGPVGQTPST